MLRWCHRRWYRGVGLPTCGTDVLFLIILIIEKKGCIFELLLENYIMRRNIRTKEVKKPSTHSMGLRSKHRRSKRSDSPDGTDLEWVLAEDLDRLVTLDGAAAGRAVANLTAVSNDLVHERRHMSAEQRGRLGNDYLPILSPVGASAPRVVRFESESEPEEE